ncbi:MAG: hypothetical protein IPP29_10730 [Bacteroidetes bacterium]|nr:hypothetical protein [Bacteroidota bacterium]
MKLKKSIAAKDIQTYKLDESKNLTYTPISGDVAIFEIIETGKHETIQSDSKRNVGIFPGDKIMACFADRYATSQFEGYIPTEPTIMLHILGAGGAIGIVKSKNWALKDIEPTVVKLVGYCCDENNKIINSKFYNKPKSSFTGHVPNNAKIILSIGSTMDSGKTTTAAFLARGLKQTGKKVAFIKFTGTSYTKDKDFVFDCGADVAIDFSDMGFPSTFMCDKPELLDLYQSLLNSLEVEKPNFIVMEIADGLMQRETNSLLKSTEFMNTIHSVIFSCGDSLGAFYGIQYLKELGVTPAAISGRFTMSPLLIEEVIAHSAMHVLNIDQLMTGEYNNLFISQSLQVA